MGCDFVAGRAELAPQVVQTIGDEPEDEDNADCVDDTLIGLMTNSMGEQSTTRGENHCAMETEVCLVCEELAIHRSVDDDCKGGDEAGKGALNHLRGDNIVDRDCGKRMSRDEPGVR